MARIIRAIVIASAALLFLPQSSLAFTCSGSIISKGDLVDIIVAKCGEPTARRVVKEELSGSYSGTSTYEGYGRATQEGTVTGTIQQSEVLLYNCGDGRLIHVLTFRGGKLEKIETSGHGSGPRRCD